MITKSNSKLFITIVGLLGLFFVNVSTAARMVSIPSLYGLTEQQAREALTSAGVKGQVHVGPAGSRSDCERDDVPSGRVCGQSPAPAGEQPTELEVWVFLKTAEKITISPVTGWPVEEAKKRYRRSGGRGVVNTKVVGERECYQLFGKAQYEKGIVCGVDPRVGSEVPSDIPITLYAQGDRTVDDEYGYPPDVRGMPLDEAISVLTEFRFTSLSVKFSDDKKCQPGIVCSEWDGGVKLRKSPHTSLRIVVGSNYRRDKRAQGIRMPNLLGLTPSKARDRLDAIGVRGNIRIYIPDIDGSQACHGNDAIRDHGQVCYQSYSPGRKFGARNPISLRLETRNKPDAEMAGEKSWIPMPETAGMSFSEASAMLKEKGFKRVTVERVDRSACEPNIVCASSVKAGKRGYFDTPKTLFVGIDPTTYPSQETKPPNTPTKETQKTPVQGVTDDVEGRKAKPKSFF